MAPVIDHTKYRSKQEWLESYPEWSISGVSKYIYYRIINSSYYTQINCILYIILNVFGPFILAYTFPSLLAPIIAMMIMYTSYTYIIPLWTPHEIEHDITENKSYVPTHATGYK